ncbi:MAG: branched-chain amino acid transport system II carrier protein [Holosporales bacterium]|jgi:LIVCS family branched-chain amino acid:cation transporter|nr:branched-chain amino acid transport system II carrier protein [Holosporales bacterium]
MSGMLSKSTIAGFAIFSMIFGSGNIVFPLILGKNFPSNLLIVLIGWLLAAVIIPMGSYYGAMLFDGENKKYLAPIGKHATFILMFIIMMMVGPFGVMARITNVAFGGIFNMAPQLPLFLFSLVYTITMVCVAYHPGKIVQIIGVVFTPVKFGGLLLVIVGALWYGGAFEAIKLPPVETWHAAASGFCMGYQTMDLLASFMLVESVYLYIKNSIPEESRHEKKKLLRFAGVACVIGSLILTVAYIGLASIGALYSDRLAGTPDESLFGRIAELALGPCASWIVSIVIAISCLATNIVLCSVFTDYIHKDILRERFNRNIILLAVGAISFSVSLLGFHQICVIMGMILEKVYPALILYATARIAYYYVKAGKKQ